MRSFSIFQFICLRSKRDFLRCPAQQQSPMHVIAHSDTNRPSIEAMPNGIKENANNLFGVDIFKRRAFHTACDVKIDWKAKKRMCKEWARADRLHTRSGHKLCLNYVRYRSINYRFALAVRFGKSVCILMILVCIGSFLLPIITKFPEKKPEKTVQKKNAKCAKLIQRTVFVLAFL